MRNDFQHIPVLLDEVLEAFDYLKNINNAVFIDCTLGLAGHSLAIAVQTPKVKMIGIDKDEKALKSSGIRIKSSKIGHKFSLIHADFNNFEDIVNDQNFDEIDGALIDLGVSSMQFDDKARGFSFSDLNAPLDMRMDQDQKLSAKEIVNNYPAKDLEQVLRDGEERFARLIANNIVKERKIRRLETVGDLIGVLEKSIPIKVQKTGKTHFATGTFRALRLEVNNEISSLAKTIKDITTRLLPGAKLAIISFHSIEDRIVKNAFRDLENPCKCPPKLPCVCGKQPMVKILTKKPVIPSDKEIQANPRSRSAKLRVIEKLPSTTNLQI